MQLLNLTIKAWNVFGIFKNINGFQYNKLHDPDFIGHLKTFQIFGLIETHHTCDDIDKLQLYGYKCFQVCRKKLKFGRKHGGLAVYVHNSILPGVSKLAIPGSETIILKLKSDFFSFTRDIMLSFTYCAPSGSSYLTRTRFDPFSDLEIKLTNALHEGDLLCFGDFNARTGEALDYLNEEDNENIPIPDIYYTEDSVATYPRGNRDKVINQYGERLLSLCRSLPLRICNGRKLGDIVGDYTCYKYNGQSVVDYCLASPDIYNKLGSFKIHNLLPHLSDHCAISVTLATDIHLTCPPVNSNYSFLEIPRKLKWSAKIRDNYENIVQISESKTFLSNFSNNKINQDQNSIDLATKFFTDFLINSATQADNETPKVCYKGSKKSNKPNWKYNNKERKLKLPKWHDLTCENLRRKIQHTSLLLKKFPKNSYLLGCLNLEQKKYKKLVKKKHKDFINSMFTELDGLYNSNPRGYMTLVKSLRDGSFDKKISDNSSSISPDRWKEHFTSLLGPSVPPTQTDLDMTSYIAENCDNLKSELDNPIKQAEVVEEISKLENNKAVAFDRVSNEMLKAAKLVIAKPLLNLFNAILSSATYPSAWKDDILSPLHKSGEKTDPNNFRGLAVSSCLGKLFNKILQRRLDKLCKSSQLISDVQGSGKPGSRTCDHLLVLRCLFDKYVKHQGKHLYTCFDDLKKAFDTVPRVKLFYTLVKDYSIGGNFLKILQQIYSNNKIFIKLSDGLVHPFITTVGVKQGCVFSPVLFNLFINKICSIFDQTCDPVELNNFQTNCLLWADDLLLFSKTPSGLQNSINKMQSFYDSLGLTVNIKKTKVMIFNRRGVVLDKKYIFSLKGINLEITGEYQYLGLKLKPSGTFSLAVQELNDKATRAWYGISNIIFKNKRMQVDRIFSLFDSLVTPVATYGSPLWLPFTIKNKNFENLTTMLDSWENFNSEVINQKCAKMALSVNKTTSRLAVLGELGRYPLFLSSLSQCLNYKQSLVSRKSSNKLVACALNEMKQLNDRNIDCWLARVIKVEKVLKISKNIFYNKSSGKKFLNILKGKFDRYFLDKINEIKITGSDLKDHNKLRTYKTLKSSFTREPYVDLVRNRNQRCYLSRLRTSSHRLRVELGRHTRPTTPFNDRTCLYCPTLPPSCPGPPPGQPALSSSGRQTNPTDDEFHFLMECQLFKNERSILFNRVESINTKFATLSTTEQFKTLLCPVSAVFVKLIHRFVKNMFESRDKYDEERSTQQ